MPKRHGEKNLNGTDREVICEAIAGVYSALVDSRRAIHRIGPLLTTHSKHGIAQKSDIWLPLSVKVNASGLIS